MRKWIIAAAVGVVALAAILMFVLTRPAEGDDQQDGEGQVELHPEARIVEDPEEITHWDPDSGELATTGDVEVGEVIVAGITPATPEGLLVRVEEITADGTLRTSPAQLTDVIADTGGPITLEVAPSAVDATAEEGVTYQPNVSGGSAGTFGPIIEGELAHRFRTDMNVAGLDGRAGGRLVGTLETGVNASLEVDIGLFAGLRHLDLQVNPKASAEFTVEAFGVPWRDQSRSVEIGMLRHTWPFSIGPVPVPITTTIGVGVDIESALTARVKLSKEASADLLFGYRYEDGEGQPSFTHTTEMKPLEVEGTLTGSWTLMPFAKVEARAYGLIGVFGKVGPFTDVRATSGNEFTCVWNQGLRGQVGANAGIRVLGADLTTEWSTNVDWLQVKDAPCPFLPPEPLELSISPSGDPEWVVGEPVTAVEVTVSGGHPDSHQVEVDGELPPGVTARSASSGMTLLGTPQQAGTYRVTFRAVDDYDGQASREMTFTVIEPAPPEPPPPPLGTISTDAVGAVVGYRWGMPLIFTGGRAPFEFTAQNLPPGIELVTEGVAPPEVGDIQIGLSGVPQQVGSWDVTVTITDAAGQSLDVEMGLQVQEVPDPLPDGWEEAFGPYVGP